MKFAPVMTSLVVEAAVKGMPVLGICNGFQVLCEAGLLPGALTRNEGLHFICRDVWPARSPRRRPRGAAVTNPAPTS